MSIGLLLGAQTTIASLAGQTLQLDLAAGGYHVNPATGSFASFAPTEFKGFGAVIVSGTGSGTNFVRVDTTTGGAWVEIVGQDLATYASADTATPHSYKIRLTSATGTLTAHLGAQATGEALSANFVTNGTFDSDTGWTKYSAVISGGVVTFTSGSITQDFSVGYTNGIGQVLKFTGDYVKITGNLNNGGYNHTRTPFVSGFALAGTTSSFVAYRTTDHATGIGNEPSCTSGTLDNYVVSKVTEPNTLGGFHLLNSYSGSTRGVTKTGSFDPNNVTKWEIFRSDIAPAVYIRDNAGALIQAYARPSAGETVQDIIGGANPALLNGDFESAEPPGNVWIRSGNTVISGGVAVFTSAGGDTTTCYQAITSSAKELYKLTATFVVTSGSIALRLNNNITGQTRTVSGTYSDYLTTTTGVSGFAFRSIAVFTGTADNSAYRRVLTPLVTGLLFYTTCDGITRGVARTVGTMTLNGSSIYSIQVTR